MKRLTALTLALAVLASGGCSSIEKLNPFASSVPKTKPAELGPIQSGAELRGLWQGSVGAAGEYSFSPAIAGNSVYAAGQDGSISRFDGGRQVWRITAGEPISGGVGSDGNTVVVGTAKGDVLAYDAANGRERWKARVSSEVLAAPAVSEGLAVVRSGDARLFALDTVDGKRRWFYQRSVPTLTLRTSVGAMQVGRHTLAGFPGGKLVALTNNNGGAVWEATVALPKGATELERVADITSLPVVNGNLACAVAYQGRVACFDLNSGNNLWSRELSSSVGLDMDAKYVYVTDDKGAVHALERNSGASIWKQDKLAQRGVSRPLTLGGRVIVADYQGVVHVLRREDGAFVARATTDGSAVKAAPQSLGSTAFVVQTAKGGLFAMELK